MRILRLDIGENGKSVEMHPLITVVPALDDTERASLLQHLRSLARGSAVGVSGLIEDQSKLVVLDGEGTIALSHVTTVDVVADLDSAAIMRASASSLQAEIDQLQRQADIDAALVEEIRAQLDPTVKARLAQLRLELQSLIDGVDPDQERRVQLEEACKHAASHDQLFTEQPDGVSDALAAWNRYQAFLGEHQDYLSQVSDSMSQAEMELKEGNEALVAAEANAVPVFLTGDEESRLFELEEARNSREWQDGSADSKELNALLEKVGVTSWTGYTMYRMSPLIAPDRVEQFEKCQADLEQYEQAFDEVRAKVNADPVVSELEQLRSDVAEQAQIQLGSSQISGDIGAALRGLQQTQVNPEWIEAQKELLSLLQTPGFNAPDSLDLEGALHWSRQWLRQHEESGSEARGEDRVRDEIAAAEEMFGRHNRAMAQMDRVEQSSSTSKKQIERIHQAREESEQRGSHHTAELLSYIRSMTEQAVWESSSAIPVAVSGGLNNIDVPEFMGSLELIAQQVQIVVISDSAEAVEWVESVGPERALVSNLTDEQIGSS